ncbi:MAG: OmpH family outer membrane protein [Spirochaetales bacterium]|nr:OmpH family outer membrane protein [Spirochaetales bacterium]
MKRFHLIAVLVLATCGAAAAQQITRIGVIDLQKVYMTYYKDSQAVRAFEEDKQKVEAEIQRLGDEIKGLQAKRVEFQAAGDEEAVKTLDETIYKKALFLQDFIKVKQAELEDRSTSLTQSDAFGKLLYRTVQAIAEAEGYSLILSSKNADNVGSTIIWFSSMIDITDKVIQALVSGQ